MRQRVSCPWFVGRTEELGVLTGALDEVLGGGSATVLIGGDAGIGKTRLVTELASRARAADAEVLIGGCLDLAEGGAPYAPVLEVLERLGTLVDVGDPAVVRPAEVLPGALTTLTETTPVMLLIEDLHWADPSTRDLVTYLAAGRATPRLLLVVTYRADDLARGHPLRPMLATIDRADRVRHLRLGPFGPADLAEQLRGILGEEPDVALVRAVIERSDGNPFLTEELADCATEPALTPGIRDVLLARLDRLPDQAQRILRTAAVGGRRIPHALLEDVIDVDEPELSDGLRAAVSHHLIVADEHHYEFRHALLHEAVLGDLMPGERASMHAHYARAIERHPALGGHEPAAALLHHWDGAGHRGPALAAALDAAAAAETAYALPEAFQYYEWAIDAWESTVPHAIDPDQLPLDRDELLHRAADAASRAGKLDRAAQLVGEALRGLDESVDPARAGLLHERRGWCLLQAGRVDAALDAYRHAIDLVPAVPPTVARARVLAGCADANERADRLDDALVLARQAIRSATSARSPADEGHARHTLGVAIAATGDRAAGLAELEHALRIAEDAGDVADAVGIHLHLWRELAQLGRAGEVVGLARDGAARARQGGADVLAGVLDGLAAGYCHQLGRWDEADELLDTSQPRTLEGVVHLIVGGLLDVDRGDFERAGDRLEYARSYTDRIHDGRLDGLVYRGLAERAWWRGRGDDVHAIVAAGLGRTTDLEMVARLTLLDLRGSPGGSVRVEAAEQLQALDARALVRRLEPTSELRAAAATGAAEVTRAGGGSSPAAWTEAAARWDGLGFPLAAVYARWRLAEALLAEDDGREEAASVMSTAWAVTDQLDAAPWRSAIEAAARRGRISIAGASEAAAQPAPSDGGFGLTPRENEVLVELARGRTNKQIAETLFISEKTARVHVSHILAKLTAATRGEAVDIAHRHGMI
jgi:DNA-binding CsgD family transcriptional regulator/tetratricopeptide (TPR) repeat protein